MIADPGGSGLNDRVDALGGHLWLHSSPAPATVRAELPLRQTHAQRYLRSTSKDVATNRHTSLQQGGPAPLTSHCECPHTIVNTGNCVAART